jgi:hypothetical protein
MSVIVLINHKLRNYQNNNLSGMNNLFNALLMLFNSVGIAIAEKLAIREVK